MNFFKAKQAAKRSTFFLLIVFVFSLLAISLVISVALTLILQNGQFTFDSNFTELLLQNLPFLFFKILPVVMSVLILASLYKLYELYAHGGSFIAQSLNGQLVSQSTTDLNEKKLLNIVDEMAIASGIIVPQVYIVNDESINAFAAGFSLDDVVIGVTSGSIKKLNRDELQGVIAHEFSHIFNGDMKLNMKLSGAIYGFLFLGEFGRIIMHATNSGSTRSSSNGKDNKTQVYLIALVFMIFGYIGYFFGQIIKAMINRQREFLADASAVQYTRNNFGIANALKKIGGDVVLEKNDLSQAGNLYAHMFFSNISQLFSTHPPLDIRIKRLDKNWDETYILDSVNENKNEVSQSYAKNIKEDDSMKKNAQLILASIGSLDIINQQKVSQAKNAIDMLPKEILNELDSPFGALCVILSFTVNKHSKLASIDFDTIEKNYGIQTVSTVRQLWLSSKEMSQKDILLGIELLIPRLMLLSKTQYLTLKSTFDTIIKNDGKITYFEWLTEKLVINKLDISFKIAKIQKVKYNKINALQSEISLLLSIFINIDKNNDTISKSLFLIATSYCKLSKAEYINSSEHNFDALNLAIAKIKQANSSIQKDILSSLIEAYTVDESININEYYLIKVLSIFFNIPFPLHNKF